MSSDIKLDLDAMLNVYDSLLSEWSGAILKGNPVPPTARKMAHLDGCAALSDFRLTEIGYQDNKIVPREVKNAIVDKRKELLLGLLYDRLISVPETTLDSVLEKVRDPLLDAATIWLTVNGGIKSTRRSQFAQSFNPLVDMIQYEPTSIQDKNASQPLSKPLLFKTLNFYFRPIMLLELIADHPEIIPKLEENSSYFMHRLFEKKKYTLQDIESEIAEMIPDFFSDRLLSVLQRADEFVQHSQEGVIKVKRLGRYILPPNFPVSFVKSGANAEREFKEMFTDAEIKREIYTTLGEVSLLITREVIQKYGCLNPLKNNSTFAVGESAYATIKRLIRNYAMNQLLGLWKESDIPSYCPETSFSRLMFIEAELQGERLMITDNGLKKTSTVYFTKDSRPLDTSIELPFCVYILNRYYKTATDINAERSASAQQETQ